MIEVLRHFDARTAIGILARAALSLDGLDNPASQAILDNEMLIRRELLAAARLRAGVSDADHSPEAIEKIGDVLDLEADGLAGPFDMQAALKRLAEGGNLPTDMYDISFNPGFLEQMEDWAPFEKELIEITIRHPHQQQHFARSASPKEPSLASLFYRRFKTKWPFKDFNLLVVASRNGLMLEINQSWRIYSHLLDTDGSTSLVDILRRFANTYGSRIQWEGKTGSFFLTVDNPLPREFTYKIAVDANEKKSVGVAQLATHQDGKTTASLVVAIDLLHYHDVLNRMRVRRDEIIVDWPSAKPLVAT